MTHTNKTNLKPLQQTQQNITMPQKHKYFLRQKSIKSLVTSSTQMNAKTSVTTVEKTCGLFDSNFIDMSDKIDTNDLDKTEECFGFFDNDLDLSVNMDKMSELVNDQNSELDFEKQVCLQEFISNENTKVKIADKCESKFTKKLNDQNFKIKIPMKRQVSLFDPLKLDEDDYKMLITPNTEKLCMQFIKSIPTLNSDDDLMQIQTPTTLTTPQLFTLNPFITTTPTVQNQNNSTPNLIESSNINEKECTQAIKVVTLDHDYTSLNNSKKRNNSYLIEESSLDSMFSSTTNSECFTSTSSMTPTTSQQKRKRAKGIYRAKDVTNDDELVSYLERRKKNNVSSKQSRLSKKKFYNEMDEKANHLEKDNERLKNTIQNLESLTKLMKDALLQRFTTTPSN